MDLARSKLKERKGGVDEILLIWKQKTKIVLAKQLLLLTENKRGKKEEGKEENRKEKRDIQHNHVGEDIYSELKG